MSIQSENLKKYCAQDKPEVHARRAALRLLLKGNKHGGRPKGSKNRNPYPKTEAVLERHRNHPPPSWKGKTHTAEYKAHMSKLMSERIRRNGPSGCLQGKYTPAFPDKYVGNVKNVVYRSSWERVMMAWLDKREDVIRWSSEELSIPYFDPVTKQFRRYFPDFVFTVRTMIGEEKTIIAEVKPHMETFLRQSPRKQTRSFITEAATFAKNQAKWAAATEYCKDKGWEFKVLTEYDLGIKKRT